MLKVTVFTCSGHTLEGAEACQLLVNCVYQENGAPRRICSATAILLNIDRRNMQELGSFLHVRRSWIVNSMGSRAFRVFCNAERCCRVDHSVSTNIAKVERVKLKRAYCKCSNEFRKRIRSITRLPSTGLRLGWSWEEQDWGTTGTFRRALMS